MKYDKISGFADEIAEDVDTQFRVLKKLDIRYFEPRGIDGKNIAALTDGEVRAALSKRLEELEPGAGLVIGVDRSHVL